MCLASFPNNSDKEKSKWKGLELRKDPAQDRSTKLYRAQDRSTKLHSVLDEYFISYVIFIVDYEHNLLGTGLHLKLIKPKKKT